jgi:hypothetical protein
MYARIEKECGGESASLNIAEAKSSPSIQIKSCTTGALAPIALQQVSLDYNYPGGAVTSAESFSPRAEAVVLGEGEKRALLVTLRVRVFTKYTHHLGFFQIPRSI